MNRHLQEEIIGIFREDLIDQVEKVVISKVKEHNDVRGFNEIYIIPIRYSLEIVSHIHRVISTDGGHMVIGGNGGEG